MISHIKKILDTFSQEINPHEQPLIKAPPRIMVYFAAILILSAFFLESKYFPDQLIAIIAIRVPATVIALLALLLIKFNNAEKRMIWLIHMLLLTVVISSGLMIYFVHNTLLINASIVGFMILTSGLFLNWELKNQVVVAGYYNIIFAIALFVTYQETGVFSYMLESF